MVPLLHVLLSRLSDMLVDSSFLLGRMDRAEANYAGQTKTRIKADLAKALPRDQMAA